MANLDDVTVFNDIRERLAAITPEQIESAARKIQKHELTDPKAVIGAVTSPSTRALWALVCALRAQEALFEAQAEGATDPRIESDYRQRAAVSDFIGDVAREMFWAQAKIDCGFFDKASTSLRGDWQLIKGAGTRSPFELVTSIMGGGNQ